MSVLNTILISANIISTLTNNVLNLSYLGAQKLYSSIHNLGDVSMEKYKNELDILDLEVKLKYLEHIIIKYENCAEPNYLFICNKLRQISFEIKAVVGIINTKIEEHQMKYLRNWRSINLDKEFGTLNKLVKILDERLKLIH